MSVALFILLSLIAEVLGTVGGFGSSLFFVPIASFFFDFQTVLGITALFHLASNISKIALFKKGIDKGLLVKIGIPAVIFVMLGAWLSKWLATDWLEISLAIFLIALSLVFLLFKSVQLKPTTANAVAGGTLSGLIAGLVGTGGAIRGITLTAFGLTRDVFVATSATIDLGIDFSRSVVYFANGYMHKEYLYLIPILLGVSLLGTWIGKKILEHVSDAQFRKIVLVFVLVTGLITVGKIIWGN